MSEHRPESQQDTGAFLGPDIAVGLPTGVLGQDPLPEKEAPEGDDAPEVIDRPGPIRRLLDRLTAPFRG